MTDKYHGHMTMNDGSHVALSKDEAESLWQMMERADEDRAKLMPTSDDAMRIMLDAQQRMKALGWRKGLGIVGVKRGDECAVRQDGSTGIWTGWVQEDGKYVMYCDGVSDPRKVWLKPISELSEDEATKLAECDRDDREYQERMIQSYIAQDAYTNEERD